MTIIPPELMLHNCCGYYHYLYKVNTIVCYENKVLLCIFTFRFAMHEVKILPLQFQREWVYIPNVY